MLLNKNFLKENSLKLFVLLISSISFSQTNVEINPVIKRFIENVSNLDRTKYFNIHSNSNDAEHVDLINNYKVNRGRGFWGPFSYAKSQTGQVGVYPNYRDGNNDTRNVSRFIATEHPNSVFKDNINWQNGADWAVEYYKDFANDDGRPEFFELMNEPFVHADDFYTGPWSNSEQERIKLQMAKFYNAVGLAFKNEQSLSKMKVIGYSSAWPSMEINNFKHWDDNMKMFMDVAGDNMYGFATHLYDGINVSGQDNKRSGSNSEAILDLIETYSFKKWGFIKPHAISEYGAIESGFGDNYSDIASIQTIRSINHILFNLLEREDKMAISIPFITGKGEWHITAQNNYQPYSAALWKPTNLGEPIPEGWEYTPKIRFYEMWKYVSGSRVFIKSDNPDVQSIAFVNTNDLFVALNNLDDENQTINLNINNLNGFQQVRIKSLKIYNNQLPEYTDEIFYSPPSSITLAPGETIILTYKVNNGFPTENIIRKKNYYNNKYLVPINANVEIPFNFNDVSLSGDGYANLRMSIGRKHDRSKKPILKINGTTVSVPNNWAGYDQANRDDFFGMINIPVPYEILSTNNIISVEFPDNDGKISSLILSVENFDNTLNNNTFNNFESKIIAYPNPVDDFLTIELEKNNNKELEIALYSNIGVLIRKEKVTLLNNRIEYSTKNLASGLYHVVLTSSINTSSIKFIKK